LEQLQPPIDASLLSVFAYHLAAYINATNATSPTGDRGPMLAVDVAIDLAATIDALRETAPIGGATYVCTVDGTVLAGSNWQPDPAAMYDPEEGMVVYPRLWDLGFAWTEAVSRGVLASGQEAEMWHGSDMVVSRALAVGDPKGGSYRACSVELRVVTTAPRSVGTSKNFKNLIHGAMGILGAPGVFLLLALCGLASHHIFILFVERLFERIS
jgi:hypothetical protein